MAIAPYLDEVRTDERWTKEPWNLGEDGNAQAALPTDEMNQPNPEAVERLMNLVMREDSLDWSTVDQMDNDGWETDEEGR